jgi:thiol-disulfide isomerase/thioredoxin
MQKIFTFIFILCSSWAFSQEVPRPMEMLQTKTPMPKWELTDIDGKKFIGDSIEAKLILIDFWYKACVPCQRAAPVIETLYNEFRDSGLVVLGMNVRDKESQELRKYLEDKKITYPTLLDAKDVAADFRVGAYPTFYMIGKDHKVILAFAGYSPELEEYLRDLIVMFINN